VDVPSGTFRLLYFGHLESVFQGWLEVNLQKYLNII